MSTAHKIKAVAWNKLTLQGQEESVTEEEGPSGVSEMSGDTPRGRHGETDCWAPDWALVEHQVFCIHDLISYFVTAHSHLARSTELTFLS